MQETLRILQIANYMYPHRGGIEQVTRDVANALKAEACEQRILCFNEDAEDRGVITRRKETTEDEVDGIPVIRCSCVTKLRSQSVSFTFPKILKETLRTFRPDVVVFHYPNPFQAGFLLRYLARQTKQHKPPQLILYWHLDIVKQKLLRLLFANQNKRLLQRADLIIATSPNYIKGSPWLQSVKQKCTVIPNCISTDRLTVTEKAEEIAAQIRSESQGKIICTAIGRNVPYKGLSFLIQASKLLPDQYEIYIAGKGTEELKEEAQDDPKVHLLGAVDDNTLKGLLLATDIFCFSSVTKNEAFGIALAEAMYYEKPAVTFTIPGSGVNYVCPNGECGIEVPNGDAKAYAEAIQVLGSNPALRQQLARNAKQRSEALFTTDRFNKELQNAFIGQLSTNNKTNRKRSD